MIWTGRQKKDLKETARYWDCVISRQKQKVGARHVVEQAFRHSGRKLKTPKTPKTFMETPHRSLAIPVQDAKAQAVGKKETLKRRNTKFTNRRLTCRAEIVKTDI